MELTFSNISGQSVVFSKYELTTHNDFLYITPAENAIAKKINPLENIDQLMTDIISVTTTITNCEKYMHLLVRASESNVIFEKNFWRSTDFFSDLTNPEASSIVHSVMQFTEKYGLPKWELETYTKAELPLEYASYSTTMRDETVSSEYLKKFLSEKIDFSDSIAYPVCSLTVFFLNLFNIITSAKPVSLRRLDHCRLYYDHDIDKNFEVQLMSTGLEPSILLAFIAFTNGEKKAIHMCKNCGTYFITKDFRSEYCSPKCRASYNTAQTRKRQKQKELEATLK